MHACKSESEPALAGTLWALCEAEITLGDTEELLPKREAVLGGELRQIVEVLAPDDACRDSSVSWVPKVMLVR